MVHTIVLLSGVLVSHRTLAPSCLDLAANPVGATWTYAGTRLWSSAGAARADSGAVEWTSTLVAKRDLDAGYLMLVRGFVTQLAWSDPGTPPGLSVLACVHERLVLRDFDADSEATKAFDRWTDSLAAGATLLVEEPLRDGTVFGQDPPRDDDMYGWSVELLDPAPNVPSSCHPAGAAAFRLTMRTLPEHAVMEWRPGIGVTAYLYGHHGTPAGANVRLIRCGGSTRL